MASMLEALHRLQDCELKLAQLRQEREAKARRVEAHQRRVRKADEQLQRCQLATRERQKRLDFLQLDVASREESIDKHRQALNKAKTNKEYAAILTALNTEKADNSKLETEILQLMEAVQTAETEAASVESEKAKFLSELARAEEVLRAYDADSQPQRDSLQTDREHCAEGLLPTTLATFNRVAGHHDGEAIAPVVKIHPKRDEYVCSGCNMNIALEVVNSLQTREDLQVCKVCGRILCLEPSPAQRAGT